MRVALLSPSFHPIVGGTERYVATLAAALTDLGVSSEVITLCDTKKWLGNRHLREKRVSGTRVLSWPSHPLGFLHKATGLVAGAHFVPTFVDELKRHLNMFDLVHFHDEVDLSFPISLIGLKKPKLFTFHTLSSVLPFYRANPIARRMLTTSSHLFHAFSKDDREPLGGLGIGAERIRVVPQGVNVHAFHPREEWSGNSVVRIASISRIDRGKGIIDLLSAANVLKTEFPAGTFEVRIVGPVDDERYYRELVEYKQRMNLREVEFVGALSHEDGGIESFLARSDIFVLSSLREDFPIVTVEGMAAGLPVVATRVEGNPEAIVDGETGFIVPVNDPKGIAEKLAVLIRDKQLRREMGRKGRTRAESMFSIEKTTEMIVDICKELTNSSE